MAEATKLGLLSFQEAIRGGVRPILFSVTHGWPGGVTAPVIRGADSDPVQFMCKSAALPATNVGTV